MNVFEVMTRRVYSCRPEDTLATVAGLMWDHDVGCAPILDAGGRPVGMITDRDICMAAYTRGAHLAEIDVASVMSRHLYACTPEQSVTEAEDLMRLEQIRRMPVVDAGGKLIGLLSLADVAREAVQQKRRPHGELLDEEVTTTLAAVSEPRALA